MKFLNLIVIISIISYVLSIKIKSKSKKSESKQYYNGNPNYYGTQNTNNVYQPQPQQYQQQYANRNPYANLSQRDLNTAIETVKSQIDHPIQISNSI